MQKFLRALVQVSSVVALVAVVNACGSKKTASDDNKGGDAAAQGAPQIDNSPMSFDAAGSDSGKIDGLKSIHFDYDKAALRESERKVVQANVEWMKKHNNVNVQIEGHCDARGSIEYNLALGERRARAVKEYMVSLGLTESRLSVISYGKEKPLVNGDSEAAYSKNRRANFMPLAQ